MKTHIEEVMERVRGIVSRARAHPQGNMYLGDDDRFSATKCHVKLDIADVEDLLAEVQRARNAQANAEAARWKLRDRINGAYGKMGTLRYESTPDGRDQFPLFNKNAITQVTDAAKSAASYRNSICMDCELLPLGEGLLGCMEHGHAFTEHPNPAKRKEN